MEANVPNLLTLSRILATPVVCLLLVAGTPVGNLLALSLYLFACVTDFLDGYLARLNRQQSSFGKVLDPIADKLLVSSVLLVLVGVDRLQGTALLPALVILCREILVSGLREYLAHLNVGLPVTRLAKWKTTLQMVALGFLITGDAASLGSSLSATQVGVIGLWAAAALTMVTGYDYLRAGLRYMGDADKVSPGLIVDYPRTSPMEPVDHVRDIR
jgi:cardiolipin synthase